jgi:hypothetical protein
VSGLLIFGFFGAVTPFVWSGNVSLCLSHHCLLEIDNLFDFTGLRLEGDGLWTLELILE